MRPRNEQLARRLDAALSHHDGHGRPLPGIRPIENRMAFIEQLVESIRRVTYARMITSMGHSPLRADPTSDLFDPLRAAVLHHRQGNIDEACWLVFLSTHFGKHLRTGWRLTRDIYRSLGSGPCWTWNRVSATPGEFRQWLTLNYATFSTDGVERHFGNHRKYETLSPDAKRFTGAVVESYVHWVGPLASHQALIAGVVAAVGSDAKTMFDQLYMSMNGVLSFGRTARFDYLTMLGKLDLAPVEPGSAYLNGATGPLKGAKLLFGGTTLANLSWHDLDDWLVHLDSDLGVGMQVLEDALCNWQKSPGQFRRYRG